MVSVNRAIEYHDLIQGTLRKMARLRFTTAGVWAFAWPESAVRGGVSIYADGVDHTFRYILSTLRVTTLARVDCSCVKRRTVLHHVDRDQDKHSRDVP